MTSPPGRATRRRLGASGTRCPDCAHCSLRTAVANCAPPTNSARPAPTTTESPLALPRCAPDRERTTMTEALSDLRTRWGLGDSDIARALHTNAIVIRHWRRGVEPNAD